jgi:uncharacterized protein
MIELSPRECRELMRERVVGRIAICTASGPEIFPINYVVDGDSIVFRTAPYSTLGTYSWDAEIAFEVDHADVEHKTGWSVLAVGHAELIDDPNEVAALRLSGGPEPWAEGPRRLYIRLKWTRLTGRRIGEDWRTSWPATSG